MSKVEREHLDICSLASVLDVLREQVSKMLEDEEEESSKESTVSRERGVYLTWIAVLSNYAEKGRSGGDSSNSTSM